ncbi:iron uptake porin [Leptolyngbya sp. FACHB-17]|uniref:iron uptake porin n=1 Tax=unclassified Leptolyngbya TaxID=2650499 RepID=UPI00167FF5B2|nr:iron uptake porin [Leptolyngbya sp. FACHB-17]MBD2081876.1 carbohydrate porin [Leptolyngbya sp. FACHB-17]
MLNPARNWKLWLAAPAVLFWVQSAQASAKLQAPVLEATPAQATPVEPVAAHKLKSDAKDVTPNFDSVNSVAALEADAPAAGMEQVTSVSQFTDVRPTDWAFQALQSLVERYGCIAGYPDRTFRGNRATTRYEFAAGLNACLNRINELIAASTADLVKKEDLATLQKLQEQFAAELATIRGRVDALEARTTTLEKQQFSTTTKLSGGLWINPTIARSTGDVRFEGVPGSAADTRFAGARTAGGAPISAIAPDPEPTLSFLTWLTLNTSFTGRDSLVTQLAAGNGISPYNQYASAGFFNATGVPFFDQTAGTVNGRSDIVIRDFFYTFPVNEGIKVTVGPRINWYRHFDGNRFLNVFASGASFDTSNSTQTNTIDRGSGLVVEAQLSRQFRLALGYLGENTEFLPSQFGFNTSSNPAFGLFGGTNTASAELTFSPSDTFNLRLQYNYSRIQAYGGQVGGAIGEPIPYGYLDAGPGFSVLQPDGSVTGGGLKYAYASMFGVNFDWLVTPGIGLFGRYSFANTRLNPVNGLVRTQSFQVGAAFPDLGKKGAQATVAFLMPMDITRGRQFFASGAGDGGTQYQLEASYFYPLSNNIAIVPTFYAIFNANNFNSNPTVYVGNIRTQFSF